MLSFPSKNDKKKISNWLSLLKNQTQVLVIFLSLALQWLFVIYWIYKTHCQKITLEWITLQRFFNRQPVYKQLALRTNKLSKF